jgi:aminomethyltransferase
MDSKSLHDSPLKSEHLSLNARMVPFAGWNMPVQYPEGILAEHRHTREKASIFDICHMGEFRVKGKNAAQELDHILARAVADQKNGICRYNFMLSEKGTVIDDLIVYRIADDEFFIVVNAGTKDGDADRFKKLLSEDIEFYDESDQTAKIDLQGPESADVLIDLGFKKEDLPGYFRFIHTTINSVPCILSRTGYTGELGFEIYINSKDAVDIWRLLLENENVKPAGLGARDTLRLEMGYPLYGHEMDLETTPVEAGFGTMLKLDSEREFIGSGPLKNTPPAKFLTAFILDGRRAAREGSEILLNGQPAGHVSSGTFSPSLELAVAMGYLNAPLTSGDKVEIQVGRNALPATVCDLPIYTKGTARKSL